MPGMVGAMVVVIGVILVFVIVRAFNRDDFQVEREPIDYVPTVEGIQQAGSFPVVYPPSLPEEWKAVDLSYDPEALWSLSVFDGDDRYVGLFQARSEVDDMVEEYVAEDAEEGAAVQLDSDLSGTWQTFSDGDGDHALVARYRETVVMVVGAGDQQELREFAESLSVEAVE